MKKLGSFLFLCALACACYYAGTILGDRQTLTDQWIRIHVVANSDSEEDQALKLQVKDAIVVHSIEELLEELKKYPSEDIYIIGGDSIYKQMLPYVDTVHVTYIDHAYEADAYFPNLDKTGAWEITADSEEQTYFDIGKRICKRLVL